MSTHDPASEIRSSSLISVVHMYRWWLVAASTRPPENPSSKEGSDRHDVTYVPRFFHCSVAVWFPDPKLATA